MSDQTPSRVLDIASQSKIKLRRKRTKEIAKIYAQKKIQDQISKHRRGYDFLEFFS